MDRATSALTSWCATLLEQWQKFWFAPSAPHTLALLRLLGGSMIVYTHVVWGRNLTAFLGPDAWIDRATARLLNTPPGGTNYTFSHLYWIDSPAWLWGTHILALLVFVAFTVGWWTRFTAVLTWLLTVSYAHRLVGTQYGLDQVNAFLAMYLMLGHVGDVWSVDAWLRNRRLKAVPLPLRSSWNTVATRLIQLHLCVIYLFGGVSKMRGESWWDGSAIWFAIANLEYQSIDVTWLIHARWLIAALALVTMFWETYYCVLIWPSASRPVMLALAVAVHGFIGSCLGMITFGLAMIIMNLCFIEPEMLSRWVRTWQTSRAPQPRAF